MSFALSKMGWLCFSGIACDQPLATMMDSINGQFLSGSKFASGMLET